MTLWDSKYRRFTNSDVSDARVNARACNMARGKSNLRRCLYRRTFIESPSSDNYCATSRAFGILTAKAFFRLNMLPLSTLLIMHWKLGSFHRLHKKCAIKRILLAKSAAETAIVYSSVFLQDKNLSSKSCLLLELIINNV